MSPQQIHIRPIFDWSNVLRQHYISKSAGLSGQRAFQMSRFIQLRDGTIVWSSTIREWLREHEKPDECIYCGAKSPLTTEHILPRSCGGPDIPDNAIRVCMDCNTGKGGKRLYEWKGLAAKDAIPRIAEGKYLKLLYDLHEKRGTLNVDKKDLGRTMCPLCDLKPRCVEAGMVEKLTERRRAGGLRGRARVHVSLSRAKHFLVITYCDKRTGSQMHSGRSAGVQYRNLTRFLEHAPITPITGMQYLDTISKK